MSADELSLLFERVLALPPEERSAFIEDACARDPALRDELTSLVRTHQEAEQYFHALADSMQLTTSARWPTTSTDDYIGTTLRHYRITAKLGEGGMGVVYRAEDTRLHRSVALKLLPKAFWGDTVARERFFLEAQAAAALNHANICTIYQIDEVEGRWFIAMECVEGQTLQARIHEGPIPPEEAVAIVQQMAEGLVEAHRMGIVHRDIKPGNVMLTAKERVKLLDFGLAKVANVNLTRTGSLLGTLAYMSPEQMRGEPADARSDIWSVGVVFYEMLCGQRPFQSDYEQALLYQVLYEPPVPLSERKPSLAEPLLRIVERCLNRERAQRYTTAADLLADLKAFSNGALLPVSPQEEQPTRHSGGRPSWLLGGAAIMVLLLSVLWFGWGRGTDPASTSRTYVAVLASASDDPAHQALADGLIQSVSSMLASFEGARGTLWVVPASEILAQEVTSAAQARDLFGVNRVVRVVVREEAQTMQVNLDLEDVATPHVLDSARLPGPTAASFQTTLTAALIQLFDLPDTGRQALRAVDPEAYAYYLQGLGYLRRFHEPGSIDHAITLFQGAIAADSTYAPAYAGLCEATWESYDLERDAALAVESLPYCERAAQLGGDDPEVLVTLGGIYVQQGAYELAEQKLLLARRLAPDNTEALRWLGRIYEDRAEHLAAETAYQQAIALKPHVWINYYELAVLYDYTGRSEDALAQYEAILRLTPSNYLAYNGLGNYYRDRKQFDAAAEQYQQAIDVYPTSLSYRNLGRLHLLQGRYTESLAALDAALATSPSDLIAWSWAADAAYWAGDEARASEAWQTVLNLALGRLQVNPRDNVAVVLAADAQAGLRNTDQSLTSLLQAVALPQKDVQVQFLIGRTYERLGQRALAYHWIGQAFQEGLPDIFVTHDPWLTTFREDPLYPSIWPD